MNQTMTPEEYNLIHDVERHTGVYDGRIITLAPGSITTIARERRVTEIFNKSNEHNPQFVDQIAGVVGEMLRDAGVIHNEDDETETLTTIIIGEDGQTVISHESVSADDGRQDQEEDVGEEETPCSGAEDEGNSGC